MRADGSKGQEWDFPDGPVVKTPWSQSRVVHGFNPWSGDLRSCILHLAWGGRQGL